MAQAFALAANAGADAVFAEALRQEDGWKQDYLVKVAVLATAEECFGAARGCLDRLLTSARARCEGDSATQDKLVVDDATLLSWLVAKIAESVRELWPYGAESKDVEASATYPTLTACFASVLTDSDVAYALLTSQAQELVKWVTQDEDPQPHAWVAKAVRENLGWVVPSNWDDPSFVLTEDDWDGFSAAIAQSVAHSVADVIPF